jgi:hypothetical protein
MITIIDILYLIILYLKNSVCFIKETSKRDIFEIQISLK